ncbi:MAG: PaaI family thioesterase [Paracoccaceae bacterium]|nr:PaaI family thioesterase [Paracoccaceae bacterium]
MNDVSTPIEDEYEFQKLIGYQLVEWEQDRAVINCPMKRKLSNRQGQPHGGMLATLMDTAMGYCGCFAGGDEVSIHCMTLTLTSNYLSRPKGKMLIAEGRKTGGGKRVFFAEASVKDETGELIATASGSFRYRQTYQDPPKN